MTKIILSMYFGYTIYTQICNIRTINYFKLLKFNPWFGLHHTPKLNKNETRFMKFMSTIVLGVLYMYKFVYRQFSYEHSFTYMVEGDKLSGSTSHAFIWIETVFFQVFKFNIQLPNLSPALVPSMYFGSTYRNKKLFRKCWITNPWIPDKICF